MSTPGTTSLPEDIRLAAAQWTVRRDRGLSASESIEFELWLAADPRHAAALRHGTGLWAWLDRVPDAVAQRELARAARQRRRRRALLAFTSMVAAAGMTLGMIGWWQQQSARSSPVSALVAVGPREVTLADGTLVRMNEGSEIVERFTVDERHVTLARGEAHFTVTRNPSRPFIVTAGSLRVRAVGTAFNVNLQPARIEVLVTEGKVGLEQGDRPLPAGSGLEPLHLVARELAVAPAGTALPGGPAITVTPVDDAVIAKALGWQDALLRLGGATLAEIAAEFGRRTGQRVVIPDAAVAQLRVGGRFRADDVEGFADLLATTFEIDVERTRDGSLVLRKKSALSR